MSSEPADEPPILPEHVPVTMPDLPEKLLITTNQQFKAISDATRTRILGIIRHQPAMAKQIADRLGIAPGTAGHHLQVLEAAGLAQVVARRQVRGIVAKFYTRTARIFLYDMPAEATDGSSVSLEIANSAMNELRDVINAPEGHRQPGEPKAADDIAQAGFPHARIKQERVLEFRQRLEDLIDAFNAEPLDPDGEVFGLFVMLLRSPEYMQVPSAPAAVAPTDLPEGG